MEYMDESGKKTVLLIDDDTQFLNSLSEKFKEVGFNVATALTGKEALDYIQNNTVDFIILDFIMPEMDGFEFYHTMRYDLRKNIPTIVLTNLTGSHNNQGLEVLVKNQTDLGALVERIKSR